ncbi:hypothetical protein JYU34_006878 [Plutella xylostella]|uniref:Reverse transcriptase domain-containing protein n=1 Tax=Plutella xylostella TaxID=51655 RepID=A0ABQ7QT30_PLUXY|nr:hypothetical protein JYU34_006878 [Plutella xylostella]
MYLFADDSTAVFTGNDNNTISNDINTNLNNIIDWLKLNNLILNIDKTKIMTFRNNYNNIDSSDLNIAWEGKPIASTDSAKFLGVQIDCHLNWKEQIDIICTKLYKFSYALYMLSKVVNQNTVLTAYHAYVVSTLRYGIIFWGNSTDRDRAFKAQKRCVRAICRLKQRDSCKLYFKKLSILTLTSLYIFEVAIFVKCNMSLFSSFRSERLQNKMCAIPRKTALLDKSIFGMATKIYNHLPKILKETADIKIFKHKLKDLLLSKSYYHINEFFDDFND